MEKRSKIVLITPGDDPLPPAPCSSVDIYAYHLGRRLAREKVSVTVFARGAGGKRLKRHGMTIEEIPVKGSGMIYLRHVLKRLGKKRCTTLQVENRPRYIGPLRKRFPRTPIVLNMHSVNFLSPKLIPQSGAIKSLQQASAVIANSKYVRRELVRRFPQFEKKYHVIHPGVDLTLFPSRQSVRGKKIRQEMRRHYEVDGDKVVLLLVGRFLPRKGLTVLLRAIKLLRVSREDFELWVVGGKPTGASPFHRRVRALAKGLPVRFFPFVSSQRVHRYYLAADLLICPSQLPEAFGMVNVEAAACGLPAVGSDAWGIKESIVKGVNGWRVANYRSSKAWSTLLNRLLIRRAQMLRLGERSRKMAVKRYSWQRVAREFALLYRSL